MSVSQHSPDKSKQQNREEGGMKIKTKQRKSKKEKKKMVIMMKRDVCLAENAIVQ